MKRIEAGSGPDLADMERPVLRLFEIEEDFGRHPHAGKVDHGFYKASAASLRKRLPCRRRQRVNREAPGPLGDAEAAI